MKARDRSSNSLFAQVSKLLLKCTLISKDSTKGISSLYLLSSQMQIEPMGPHETVTSMYATAKSGTVIPIVSSYQTRVAIACGL